MKFADLQRDLAEAVRGLRRAPGFTLAVVLTLSLGLGGTLATMWVMDRVLFRPPAGVDRPEQLRRIYAQVRFRDDPKGGSIGPSYPDYEDFIVAGRGHAAFAGYSNGARRLGASEIPVTISFVTTDFFSLLGIRPLRGRFFTQEETRPISPAIDPAVLSAALWRREFGGDSSVLGRTILVSQRSFTVVGIAPEEFRGLDPNPVDLWAPVGSMLAPGSGEGGSIMDRGRSGMSFVARLQRGSWKELLDRLTLVYREGHRGQSYSDPNATMVTTPLLDPFGSMNYAGEQPKQNASLSVRLVFVSLAVLIASFLHAAIMLSLRTIQRRREIAIRLALGMSRSRLAMSHVSEAVCIVALTAGFALLFAWWGATSLDASVLSTLRPSDAGFDGRLAGVALVLALVLVAASTIVPLLTSRGISPTALGAQGVTADSRDTSLRGWLVAAEIAACVGLVMLAGLSLRSLQRISVADFGFDGARLITLFGPLGTDVRPLSERIVALPFVESASVTQGPLSTASWSPQFSIPDREAIPDSLKPSFHVVAPEYFRTVGLRLLAGRALSEADVAGAQNVIVVSSEMARAFWPGASPLGRCVEFFGNPNCRQVVGVVDDVRWRVGAPARPLFFVPDAQMYSSGGRYMLIRTRQAATPAEAAEIGKVTLEWFGAGSTPRPGATRVIDSLEPQLRPLRAAATLFLLFGVLALLSAAGGVYGLISYQVSNRTREIGIRKALGATAFDVASVVARWVARPFVVGVALGALAAFVGSRVIAACLFETASYDPLVLAGVAVAVGLSALLAAFVPARRAANLDPALALRHD